MLSAKILLINGGKEVVMLPEFFIKQGYRVSCVNTGREGVKKLRVDIFNLIIADVAFTGMSVSDLASQAKRAAGRKIPLVVIGEQDDIEDIEEFFRQGADEYIVKPLRLDYLNERVEYLVSGRF
ncbi:MAG: response regulator [Candidatus Omnitrophica bacterium]|jgi:DNA-binding response OmpR family regulator|nr:response regulator [Candidatus Omnitrophota bacterium]